jgi:hypothetical protein
VQVGFAVGMGTSLAAWGIAYLGRELIAPFEPGPDSELTIRSTLPLATISGPVAGILVSRLVIERLRARFGG